MIARLALALGLIAAGLPTVARAGAWMQPEGHGQVIVSGTYTNSDKGFDDSGSAVDIPDYGKFELNAYFEYGITDRVTAIVQPQLRSVTIGAPTDADSFGLGYTDLGARMRFWSDEKSILSGQAVARIPGSTDDNNPAQVGSTGFETDLRILYGRAFALGTWASFLDAQLAYRIRTGDPSDEVRADFTIGTRPVPKVLLLAQSFNTFSTGSAQGVFSDVREHKVQLSVVWDFAKDWSLQAGTIATVAGEETLQERGIVLGVWRVF